MGGKEKKMAEKPVAIFTNFMDFNPGYSLSGIVVDQSLMLLRVGHEVFVYVNEQFNPQYNDDARITTLQNEFPGQFHIVRKTKFMHLTDYQTKEKLSAQHRMDAKQAGQMFAQELIDNKIHVVYTHDFIFTGWNLPYSLAIKEAQEILNKTGHFVNWYHWIHSVPTGFKDWWELESYGPSHYLVFPNRTTIMQVVENFRTSPARARIIPHIKDIRTWYDFAPRTWEFMDEYPGILNADIVQIYPCSSDRLHAKQLDIVMRLFANMKNMNASVCLVAANQWATGRQPIQNIGDYIKMASQLGLQYGKEFVFTSEFVKPQHQAFEQAIFGSKDEATLAQVLDKMKEAGVVPKSWQQQGSNLEEKMTKLREHIQPYAKGIDRRMLRELQLCGSIFIFPTREESFGLVGPESALSGCLNINNRSLIMMSEVMGQMAPAFDFGSHHMEHKPARDDNYLSAVASAIMQRIYINESVMTKIHCRKRYNMDSLYFHCYLPLTLA